MDVSIVVSSAIKSVIPYFEPDQSSGLALTEDAPANVRATWSTILSMVNDDSEASAAVRGLVTRPTEPDAQTIFRERLEETLGRDSVLPAELEASVTADEARAGLETGPDRLVRLDPEDTGVYPRRVPSRRRCEG